MQKPFITKMQHQTDHHINTYVEEAVFVHVTKHMYDVSCTEGQLSLNETETTRQIMSKTAITHTQCLCLCASLTSMSVLGELSRGS